ncbi:hypothetical protein DFJ58DRAFT_842118 [Suillus subalutaceus]|uniref:uncharacterized protein n=1 Tax=Suillus subalutaceus TaxID=48586 RepID=UPI001B88126E|nr:uncharacterized protein DFJ58DRAFT_842118 [Suillus subalutaceus]KAG1851637.1 hypothetical protein DFJ58DRAFT_842118 [Suillus subalutaceus]
MDRAQGTIYPSRETQCLRNAAEGLFQDCQHETLALLATSTTVPGRQKNWHMYDPESLISAPTKVPCGPDRKAWRSIGSSLSVDTADGEEEVLDEEYTWLDEVVASVQAQDSAFEVEAEVDIHAPIVTRILSDEFHIEDWEKASGKEQQLIFKAAAREAKVLAPKMDKELLKERKYRYRQWFHNHKKVQTDSKAPTKPKEMDGTEEIEEETGEKPAHKEVLRRYQPTMTAIMYQLDKKELQEAEAKADKWTNQAPNAAVQAKTARKKGEKMVKNFAKEMFTQAGMRVFVLGSWKDEKGGLLTSGFDFNEQLIWEDFIGDAFGTYCGKPKVPVPWSNIMKGQFKFISSIYLPDDTKILEPSKMLHTDANAILDFWWDRQETQDESYGDADDLSSTKRPYISSTEDKSDKTKAGASLPAVEQHLHGRTNAEDTDRFDDRPVPKALASAPEVMKTNHQSPQMPMPAINLAPNPARLVPDIALDGLTIICGLVSLQRPFLNLELTVVEPSFKPGAGKSFLLSRFADDTYTESYISTIVSFNSPVSVAMLILAQGMITSNFKLSNGTTKSTDCDGMPSIADAAPAVEGSDWLSLTGIDLVDLFVLRHNARRYAIFIICHIDPYLNSQFSNAYNIYLEILHHVDHHLNEALHRNTPNWRLLNGCPCCTYKLKDEPPLALQWLVSIDGNNSLKRWASSTYGVTPLQDSRKPCSDYWVDRTSVDIFKDEVTETVESEGTFNCTQQWRNAGPKQRKKMFSVFDESGIFIAACWHWFVLLACDMVQSGELFDKPVAIHFGTNGGCAYNIGCMFTKTLANSSVGPLAPNLNLRMMVGTFHDWHPMYIEGTGPTKGEGCEHIFSSSNLAWSTRHVSPFHLHQIIEEHFTFWDQDKYAALMLIGILLRNHYREALTLIHEVSTEVSAVKQALNLTDADFAQFHTDERSYLKSLKEQPLNDRLQIRYVKVLDDLAEQRLEWEKA